MINIELCTILSNRTKQGMVEFIITKDGVKTKVQWDINKAREISIMLHEAIEAAISDTMIYQYMKDRIGLTEEKALMAVADFRVVRQGSKDTIWHTGN